MTITADTVVVGVPPDISVDDFERILVNANSPAASTAQRGYSDVVGFGVSPAFALAIFEHESRFGLHPKSLTLRYDLKSPGATRSTRTGEGTVINIPGRGPFVKYPMWVQGWADLAYRLVDPSFVYAQEGRKTIREIITRWAPPEDGNVPEFYIAAVVKSMNEWAEPMANDLIPCFIGKGRGNRPGLPLSPTWITIHETANQNPDADAKAHCAYIRSDEAADRPASWHVTVDDTSAYQHLPFDEAAWHAGDGHGGMGNRNSLAVELCVNKPAGSEDWERVKHAAAALARDWMDTFDISIDRVVPHNRWRDTSCPARLSAGEWDEFIALIQQGGSVPDEREINGHIVRGPFLAAYRALEQEIGAHWWTLGVPIGADVPGVPVDGTERTVQPFDRCGWLMTDGNGVVIPKPDQVRQIERELGLADDRLNITQGRLHDMASTLAGMSKELMKA